MGASSSILNDDKFLPEQLSKDELKSLIGEELFTDALFNRLRDASTDKVPKSAFLQHISIATDCFMTHDWGIDELKRNNHQRVSVINKFLQEKGLRTWFDEETMKGDIQQQMGDGIDNCGCVITFITLRYMEKVAGKGEKKELDNCYFEFSHAALTKGRVKMIAVVMEPRCEDTAGWFGKVGQNLAGLLYVNYTKDNDVAKIAEEIYIKVIQTIKEPIATRIENFIERRKKEQLVANTSGHGNENSNELKEFFENEVGCSSQTASTYCTLLHSAGVETKRKLLLRCKRDENYLTSLGVHAGDVADILFLLGNETTSSSSSVPSTEVPTQPVTPPPVIEVPLPTSDSEIEDVYREIRNGKKEKLTILQQLVNKNSSTAMYCLGMCYFQGHGVSKNLEEAVKLYQSASDAGHSTAQFNLGICYMKGEGVKKDLSIAINYFKLAAEAGNNPKAQVQLGNCYYHGRGVPKNEVAGKQWYQKAADQGYAEAQYTMGTTIDSIDNLEEALKWYKLAAEQGLPKAQHRIGMICHSRTDVGSNGEETLREGVEWFRKAAVQGFANAQNSLGIALYQGYGVEKNQTEAVTWFQKAAEQNHAEAQEYLAKCYLHGEGIAQDYPLAYHWCKKAADAKRFESVLLLEKIEQLMK